MCVHTYTHTICFGVYLFEVTEASTLPEKIPPPFPGRMVKFLNDAPHVEQILSLTVEIRQ